MNNRMLQILRSTSRRHASALVFASSVVAGCGTTTGEADRFNESGQYSVSPRRAAVVVEGCSLDSWQLSTLKSPATRKVIQEVVLLCLLATDQGEVTQGPTSSRADLDAELEKIRQLGYSTSLAMTLSNETGVGRDPARAAGLLADEAWRSSVAQTLSGYGSEGFDIALPQLSNSARADLVRLMNQISAAVKPSHKLGVFAPPSSSDPSDIPGGDAYDVGTISTMVDRMRFMTLDYSCCGAGPGPTIDPRWAVDVVQLAMPKVKSQLDISMPLYGTDFYSNMERPVTYLEAIAVGDYYRSSMERGPTGTLNLTFQDPGGSRHEVWFDDARSTLFALQAWEPPVLPSDVGVVFYGLGAEDPNLWNSIAGAIR